MIYTHDISRAFEDVVGKDGADKARFAAALQSTQAAIEVLRKHKKDNAWPILNVADRSDELSLIEVTAKRITDNFRTLVVIGMGGSSLGGKALVALAADPFASTASGVKVHFIDNIDPMTADQLIAGIDFKTTLFLVVSKSGSTAETLALFHIVLHAAETRVGKKALRDHFIIITEPGTGTLRTIANAHDMTILDHDPRIGGRFAGLTAVGLLPAKVAGLDVRAVLRGAGSVTEHTFSHKNPEPAKGAALHTALLERGKSICVMMPYCDRLDIFNTWYRQIWAESLGKSGKGTTPLRSLGTSDQHSQLQLYLDGPRDKFITMILLAQKDKGPAIPSTGDASLTYLEGSTIGDLMQAEQNATAESLVRGNCPVRLFSLPYLDAEVMGALMMHFMLETIIMAQLLKVNAFDQPAVEESKALAREYLGAAK